MGRPSIRRSVGSGRSWADQKWRIPVRVSANNASRPDTISKASQPQASGVMLTTVLAPKPSGLSSAVSMANLPKKPDSGGSPAITSVQPKKARPRKAVAAGMTRPISTSSSSSRFTPGVGSNSGLRKGASSSSASVRVPSLRQRSIRSASKNSAATARVELGR